MAWKFNQIKAYVKNSMSEKRFQHVLGVTQTAGMLAKDHGVDIDDAKLAALVHDVVKEQDLEEARQILASRGEAVYLAHSTKVWHAPLGAIVASEKFGIENIDILNAVKYHTTGRPKMSKLEKVIFVADYTEPNRKFEGTVAIREFWNDLDLAVYEILKQKVERVRTLGLKMHPDTIAAYEYYRIENDIADAIK